MARSSPSSWTSQQRAVLGVLPDTLIAKLQRRSQWLVAVERNRLGIPPVVDTAWVDWTPAMVRRLGTETDVALAAAWGIRQSTVNFHRRVLGIPPYDGRVRAPRVSVRWTSTWLSRLGVWSDARIARSLGVSNRVVALRRGLLGRPAVVTRSRIPDTVVEALGTAPDHVLARRHGLSVGQLRTFRARRSIMSHHQRMHPSCTWTRARIRQLGTVSDRALAERWHTTKVIVQKQRVRLGIRPHRREVVWTPAMVALLGTAADHVVASRLGVSHDAVVWKRVREGIAACPRTPPWTAAEDRRLGTMTDPALAAVLGRPEHAICLRRHRLGIPAFTRQR